MFPQSASHPLSHVDEYLAVGQAAGASDIHLGVNASPIWRLHGALQPIWPDAPRLTSDQTLALAGGFLSNLHKTQLNDRGDADFAYANSFGRYRTSVVRQRLGVDLVFRIINTKVRRMDELGLSEHFKLLTRYQNGLILVTGSVGSGKSTTLAALVEQVNIERREHIITLEDPIEYVLEPKGCHITQREVHTHTRSFAVALRGALREDPDVIMISESLRGVISQQLIPRSDGGGRVLALEILTNTPAVANVIREAKTFMLPGIIQTGKKQGMQLMDDALADLYGRGLISAEEALARADQKQEMRTRLAK